MNDGLSQAKVAFKIAKFVWNILSRLPTYWKLRSIFGPLLGRKKRIYITQPSIRFECAEGQSIKAFKKRGSMPGGVRIDLPWARPHDSDAAANVKVLLSEFVGDVSIVPDEDIDEKMIRENIVCIGGQSNWVFEKFVVDNNYIAPLEYRINKNKKIDGFYNLSQNQSYESCDKNYLYGLLAVITNPNASDKRIVFISGLDADSTLEITKTLNDNLKKIYLKVKLVKARHSGFFCIFRFKRLDDSKIPLIYDDVFIDEIYVEKKA